jgi:gamma-glutamyl phosphate reductase
MNKETQFSLANRKQLADMLKPYSELRSNARKRWQQKREIIVNAFTNEAAEKNGAAKLVPHINAADKHLKELRANLEALGFGLGSDGLFIHDDATALDAALGKRITKEIGQSEEIDRLFDEAQLAMMTASNLEEARKLLQSLIN